jgi:hypothetical protein
MQHKVILFLGCPQHQPSDGISARACCAKI